MLNEDIDMNDAAQPAKTTPVVSKTLHLSILLDSDNKTERKHRRKWWNNWSQKC